MQICCSVRLWICLEIQSSLFEFLEKLLSIVQLGTLDSLSFQFCGGFTASVIGPEAEVFFSVDRFFIFSDGYYDSQADSGSHTQHHQKDQDQDQKIQLNAQAVVFKDVHHLEEDQDQMNQYLNAQAIVFVDVNHLEENADVTVKGATSCELKVQNEPNLSTVKLFVLDIDIIF
ncbi:hypothetical protein LguiB_013557 [Lonicera macranthoides]